ncbi:Protein of unknown function [Gryllus bimaculatus]|nr:Protein of unknown function [Gryllus bimaculatus]
MRQETLYAVHPACVSALLLWPAPGALGRPCPRLYLPVCARTPLGLRTFSNVCMLRSFGENSGHDY